MKVFRLDSAFIRSRNSEFDSKAVRKPSASSLPDPKQAVSELDPEYQPTSEPTIAETIDVKEFYDLFDEYLLQYSQTMLNEASSIIVASENAKRVELLQKSYLKLQTQVDKMKEHLEVVREVV